MKNNNARETQTALAILVLALWPLIVLAYLARRLTEESNARQARETDKAMDRMAGKARTRAALAIAGEEAALDQTAVYTLAEPAEGTYPMALPVALVAPVQTTQGEQFIVSVYDAAPEAVDFDTLVSAVEPTLEEIGLEVTMTLIRSREPKAQSEPTSEPLPEFDVCPFCGSESCPGAQYLGNCSEGVPLEPPMDLTMPGWAAPGECEAPAGVGAF